MNEDLAARLEALAAKVFPTLADQWIALVVLEREDGNVGWRTKHRTAAAAQKSRDAYVNGTGAMNNMRCSNMPHNLDGNPPVVNAHVVTR